MRIHKFNWAIAGVMLSIFTLSCSTPKIVSANKATAQKVETLQPSSADSSSLDEETQQKFQYLFIEGLKQKMLGSLENAIPLFSKCLELNPESSAAMFELSGIHMLKGDMTSSIVLLEKAVKLNETNDYYRLMLANLYQQNKQFKEAAGVFNDLIQKNPEKQDYSYMYAMMLSSAKDYPAALVAFDKLESQMGTNETISLAKQQIYIAENKIDDAIKEIQKLIDAFPNEPKYYGLMGDLYLAQGKRDTALEFYNKILTLDPEDGFVHLSLANYYREGGEKEKAYEHIKLALANKELDVETKMRMYFMVTTPNKDFQVNNTQQLELIAEMISSSPSDERPRALYVDYLSNNNQMAEARNQLRMVINLKKDNFKYWEHLLMMDANMLDWDQIVIDANQTLEYFPTQPSTYIFKALGLLDKKEYNQMLKVLDKGIVYAQGNNTILEQYYTYQGEAYYNIGEREKAWELFDKIIEMNPQNWMVMNNYAYYLSIHNEDLEKAEELSSKTIQNNPKEPVFLDTYAWILFKQHNIVLALHYIEMAIENGGDKEASLLDHYGDILFKSFKKEMAIEQWKKALELGCDNPVLKLKILQQRYIPNNNE